MDIAKDKRTILLEAAITLFGERGFWNSSTALVAKNAGVATGTLFNYFPTKEDLIREVMVYLKREMMAYAVEGLDPKADLRDQLELLWFNGVKWGMANWSRFHLMEQIRVSERIAKDVEVMGRQYADVMNLFAKGVEQGQLQPLAPELIAELMFRQGQVITEFLLFHGEFTAAETNAHITTSFDVFWNGILRNGV